MPNYARLQATATRLINQSGRTVTFVQIQAYTTDANKPWRGDAVDRVTPTVTLSKVVTQVEPNTNVYLGETIKVEDLLKNYDKVLLADGVDILDGYHEVIDDDGSRYRIEYIYKLRPGSVTLLHIFGVRR